MNVFVITDTDGSEFSPFNIVNRYWDMLMESDSLRKANVCTAILIPFLNPQETRFFRNVMTYKKSNLFHDGRM